MTTNTVGALHASEQAKVHVGNYYSNDVHIYNEPNANRCLADLRLTDPRVDKTRIEQTKDGLLRDSYKWILRHGDFRRWRDGKDSRMLWIKGDAGKGKTMLLCGIVDELQQSSQGLGTKARAGDQPDSMVNKLSRQFKKLSLSRAPLSFFFCQGTDSRLNHATAVLRGLIYLLLLQRPSLIRHIQGGYNHAGRRLFDGPDSFYALSQALSRMLRDRRAKGSYMVIDALDECETGLAQLLDFIVQSASSTSMNVKWIVSSRNRHDIEQLLRLDDSGTMLSLELNARQVADSINTYIEHKVSQLVSLNGDRQLQCQVRDAMCRKADGTFLWAALVAKELQNVQAWDVLRVLEQIPPGLMPFYERMMEHVQQLPSENREYCRRVISTATIVYRPLHLCELGPLACLPGHVSSKLRSVEKVVEMCGSFLTIRDNHVYLIHQSAKDYLTGERSRDIFTSNIAAAHHTLFSMALQVMKDTLRRDVYHLRYPGFPIEEVEVPDTDPLAPARYACTHWVDHLHDCDPTRNAANDLQDGGSVDKFLRRSYLHWLEALSLLRSMSEGTTSLLRLEELLQGRMSQLANLVRDGYRFVQNYKWAIENSPLQVYAAALIFSPTRSIIRNCFQNDEPKWVVKSPAVEDDWSVCLQTLEGHSEAVSSVAWSPDAARLASASQDGSVKIWDAVTGRCISTLEGHSDSLSSVAWSPNAARLASGSLDGTVKIWDAVTGRCISTFDGHEDNTVWSVAWSPNIARLASASTDDTVKIWDIETGRYITTLEGHTTLVTSVAWSYNTAQLASASYDNTVKIWDPATAQCIATLEGHTSQVTTVAWLPDMAWLASGSWDKTVRIWDTTTAQSIAILEGHSDAVTSVAWLHDTAQLASASHDNTVKIWDTTTGRHVSTLKGHTSQVTTVAWLPDMAWLASGSCDNTVRIWDTATGRCISTLEGHSSAVDSVTWSPDAAWFASTSYNTVKIWDPATYRCIWTLEGHSGTITTVAWSPDMARLASASDDNTVKVWDLATGQCIATVEISRRSYDLKFDTSLSHRLYTGDGTINLPPTLPSTTLAVTSTDHVSPLPRYMERYSVGSSNAWITYQDQNLLWLHPEYRPRSFDVRGTRMVLGTASGRIWMIVFSEDNPISQQG
ncbi:hypothetical protein C8A00DRAFT_32767 [Chaetomidium leptoderma]|uniref:NACHT domain-containing protein n=1 Tax=Chaetomidium leptoderma TaxID=669021 RepID=A0AAN6ZY38_9PEZI|nr:hypothetical protein C8A00DRAFT_32767 [Chaetomidium leptoderma]